MQEQKLSSIGGTNAKDCVKRLMCHILTHEVTLRFNWAGKTGGRPTEIDAEPKKAFGELILAKVVIRKYSNKKNFVEKQYCTMTLQKWSINTML